MLVQNFITISAAIDELSRPHWETKQNEKNCDDAENNTVVDRKQCWSACSVQDIIEYTGGESLPGNNFLR